MSNFLWANEYHIVRIELGGPKTRAQLRQFNDALRRFVASSGGTLRFTPKERDTPEARPPKRPGRRPAKRPKRSRRKR